MAKKKSGKRSSRKSSAKPVTDIKQVTEDISSGKVKCEDGDYRRRRSGEPAPGDVSNG